MHARLNRYWTLLNSHKPFFGRGEILSTDGGAQIQLVTVSMMQQSIGNQKETI